MKGKDCTLTLGLLLLSGRGDRVRKRVQGDFVLISCFISWVKEIIKRKRARSQPLPKRVTHRRTKFKENEQKFVSLKIYLLEISFCPLRLVVVLLKHSRFALMVVLRTKGQTSLYLGSKVRRTFQCLLIDDDSICGWRIVNCQEDDEGKGDRTDGA